MYLEECEKFEMNNECLAPKNAINHLRNRKKLAQRESYREKVRNLQGKRTRAETWGINYVTRNKQTILCTTRKEKNNFQST